MTRTRHLGTLTALSVAALAVSGLTAVPAAIAAGDAPTPVLHYGFTETSGTTVADDSGHGYDGTITGTGATLSGDALTLPGGASGSGAAYVSVPNTPFVGKKDLTVSVWLKNSTGAGNYTAGYVGNTNQNNGYWLFNPDNPSGYVKSVLTTATAAAPSTTPWATEVGPGNSNAATTGRTATSDMALYTTVIDGDDGTESFYVDGQLVATTPITTSVADYGNASTLVAYLGRSPYPDKLFSGQIDDYAVYQSALDADQVGALFAAAPSTATRQTVTAQAAAGLDLGDLSAVTGDLTLPSTAGDGTSVTWSSSDPGVVGTTGAVTQDGTAHVVTLTATVTLGAASSTRSFAVQVPARIATAADAAAALTLPYVLTPADTLPTRSGSADVSWSSSDTSLVKADGTVVGTSSGLADVTLTATASLGGATATRTFHEQVAEKTPAYAASYTVTPGGMLNSSMHLALSGDGSTYRALDLGQGVLFAKADYVADPVSGVTKWLSDPYVFRMKDDTFGVIATRTGTTGTPDPEPELFTSPDLITYREVGPLALPATGVVSNPRASYDGAAGDYRITWTGSDGGSYVSTTSDFATFTAPVAGAAIRAGAPAIGVAGADVTDQVVLTHAEADLLDKRFSQVTNTTVTAPSLSLQQGAAVPTSAALGKATAAYSDGTTDQVPVDWSAADLAKVDTTKPGTYRVAGTVKTADYPFPLVSSAIADPDVFVYDGTYYLTGTTESAGLANLYMRESSTIAGLATATPQLIYSITSSGEMSWAPEVHEINGSWYLNWAKYLSSSKITSTVVKLTGDDPASASDWDWANAKTVTRADGSAIEPSPGITLDMTYFQSGDTWYAVWSDRAAGGPAVLKIATIDPDDPSRLTSDPVMISRPDYGWDRDTSAVDEGPNALVHDGRAVITFSGSYVDDTYVLGTLSAPTSSNLLDPASWTKENAPELSSANVPGQYGPGHNAYFTDLDGTLMMAFHARNGSGGARSMSVRAVKWGIDDHLVLDLTGDRQVLPANRAVSATVTVTPAPAAGGTSAPATGSIAKLKVTPKHPALSARSGRKGVKVTVKVTVAADGVSRGASGTVRISVGGKTRTVTVVNGVAKLKLRLKKAKRYRVAATYLGNAGVSPSATAHTVLKVIKKH